MKISITWDKTKDSLMFNCINEELAQWFVKTAQDLGNNFSTADMVTDVPIRATNTDTLISEITHDINLVNEFMPKIRQDIFEKPMNWYDQAQLNKLHKAWSRSRVNVPLLPQSLHKFNKQLFDAYHEMNCHIHLIEQSFHYTFRDNENHWRVPNPFANTMYDWQVCHLSIVYPGHGREAFEKFLNFDNEVFLDDMCNWDNIDSCVQVQLKRPYKLEPPQEFLDWCKQHGNIVPHTSTLPLANLEDWENNLTNARGTVIKNNNIPGNYFSLDIV